MASDLIRAGKKIAPSARGGLEGGNLQQATCLYNRPLTDSFLRIGRRPVEMG
jgi:hypothetical protein